MKWLKIYYPTGFHLINIDLEPGIDFAEKHIHFAGQERSVLKEDIESGKVYFECTKSKDWETVKKLLLMNLEAL
jgi:hypothetical protein